MARLDKSSAPDRSARDGGAAGRRGGPSAAAGSRSQRVRSSFTHWMGEGWGAVFTASLIGGVLCLMFGTGRTASAPAPWLRALMILPGCGMVASGIGFWMTGRPKTYSAAIVTLGLALIGGGLDYLFEDGMFLLLLLPVGVACLLYAVYLVTKAPGRATAKNWVAAAGGLLFFAGAVWFGLVVYLT